MSLKPWAKGPFELLLHAEGHLRDGNDFDRRMALIGFDNAIEVTITTYLSLHPIQRGDRPYDRNCVDQWIKNYHSKLDFLEFELEKRNGEWRVDRAEIVWVHAHRNDQYHGGLKGTPEQAHLDLVRRAALWVFSFLFEVDQIEDLLEQALRDQRPPPAPSRDPQFDRAIDREFGLTPVANQDYYTSELLFAVDDTAYRELGEQLCSGVLDDEDDP